jgi:hypothetical protein
MAPEQRERIQTITPEILAFYIQKLILSCGSIGLTFGLS